uniref:Mediator of RNA polymerase II transcription subunit 31 n=1 Tax=Compsopogon caeruleus TaxID=31354 RepID=A0A7S1XCN2_9RHOD|mmetsp:Transcript_14928/g.30361  ORF Transcript_14928/g.30361 Transcript_14928/m.30361 type:complete len:131 (+) Transcript_14928:182-574(+)
MEATEDEKEIERFETELEFVQCLASPAYIHWLAQNRYFDDDSFLAYLNYLQYWRTQEYAKFIVFPHCLYFLRLLQQESFREAMKRNDYMLFVHQQQVGCSQLLKSSAIYPHGPHVLMIYSRATIGCSTPP